MPASPVTLTSGADIASAGASSRVWWPGGTGQLEVIGTFAGGSTLQLQKLGADGTTWIGIGTALSANGVVTHDLPACYLRLLGAVATTSAVLATIFPTHSML